MGENILFSFLTIIFFEMIGLTNKYLRQIIIIICCIKLIIDIDFVKEPTDLSIKLLLLIMCYAILTLIKYVIEHVLKR